MVLDGEMVKVLKRACEQEKGLRQRGKSPKMANPVPMGTRANVGGYDDGAEYG